MANAKKPPADRRSRAKPLADLEIASAVRSVDNANRLCERQLKQMKDKSAAIGRLAAKSMSAVNFGQTASPYSNSFNFGGTHDPELDKAIYAAGDSAINSERETLNQARWEREIELEEANLLHIRLQNELIESDVCLIADLRLASTLSEKARAFMFIAFGVSALLVTLVVLFGGGR